MKDICCIGHVTLDKIVTPRQTVYMSGGTSFYFAYALNSLPPKVDFQMVTAVAPSEMKGIEKMRRDGIDVVAFNSRNTVFFENRYGIDSNNRTQRVLAKADPFTVGQLSQLDARVFHLGTLLNDDFSPEVVEYLAGKGKVSIDVQGYLREVRAEKVYAVDWADKRRVLACTDILKLNEHEMEVISGEKDPRDVARRLASWGVKEVVITLGSYGSLIYTGGRFYEIPAYRPKELVDATGCGDTYSAGYLYCRCQGAGIEDAGRFAAAMCTMKLEHNGPFSGTVEDIEAVEAADLVLTEKYM